MLSDFQTDIKKAVAVLKDGGVILYPTDTIWGIGCDATNDNAVEKIFQIKKRKDSKSMLVLLSDFMQLNRYVNKVPDIAFTLIQNSEKPLTVIFSGAKNLSRHLTGSDGSIGIRITRELFSKALIQALGKPLVSTSANISKTGFPKNFSEISHRVIRKVDYVVSYRQNDQSKAVPSKVIKILEDDTVQIIRE